MCERLADADVVRNRALSTAEDYRKDNTDNAEFELDSRIKGIIDSMPLFSMQVADKMVDKTLDICRTATLSSIRTKVTAMTDTPMSKIIAFVKTQKKDGLYDLGSCDPVNVSSYKPSFAYL